MKCKVCNKHLLEKLDLRILFRREEYHIECNDYLTIESSTEVIPINNNVIYFEYVFDKKTNMNIEFIQMFHLAKMLIKYRNSDEWSVIYIYDEVDYTRLDDISKYLLLNFGQKPIVFISMFAY